MKSAEFQLRGVGDARLAVHATSSQPAWLWSVDGTRILWANPVGARLFGARNGVALSSKTFGPADPHRRQIAQLSNRLPPSGAVRLERLRGFGAALGSLMTCACARLAFADGDAGVLIVASAPPGRGMPLAERLHNLVEGVDTPIAAFARDGLFVGASDAARTLLGFRNLTDAGLDTAFSDALRNGRVETPIGFGQMVLQRVGRGADVGLVALIAPDIATGQMASPPAKATPDRTPEPDEAPSEAVTIEPAARDAAKVEPTTEIAAVVEVDPASIDPALADPSSSEPASIEPDIAPAPEPAIAAPDHEPSALVEAVADEPQSAPEASEPASTGPIEEPSPAWLDDISHVRSTPLRFTWQIDPDGIFTVQSDEFISLLGPHTAAAFGQPWSDVAATLELDPDGRIASALATRNVWSGIVLQWPTDGGTQLPVELAGLPLIDREQNFAGYRGFGICRDLDALTRLAALRQHDRFGDQPPRSLSADIAQAGPAPDDLDQPVIETSAQPLDAPIADLPPAQSFRPTELDPPVDTPQNVVQFRPSDARSPVLSPVENSAFDELARQLSARLRAETALTTDEPLVDITPIEPPDTDAEHPAATLTPDAVHQRDWLATPPSPARGEMARDRVLLDLLPGGILIYRFDRLLYANAAFLARVGYATLQALEEAGGLDALYVEPNVPHTSSTSDGGTAVRISATRDKTLPPTDARLHAIAWDDEPAHALIAAHIDAQPVAADVMAAETMEPPPGGAADAEELATILDTTAEGIVMFDAQGQIKSCNRSAEALFGYDGDALTQRNLVDLFAPESQRVVRDYIDSIEGAGVSSLLDHGREALAQVRGGGLIPLSMTMGRTREGGPNFFAVFRDLTQAKKTETELLHARRQADRAATAKADVLARISHEVRTPLNAIIGFSEVMTDERFGPLGNERYVEYMKDIRGSGERVIAIINDLLDLSRIETGKLDLVFTTQNLNEMVEQCVAVMQPQANRGRIIIRTSLAHLLPTVVADARALRQIVLNLIGNSIHLANAGGQVIVSTALSDFGDVVLRVRDTGHGMSDNELAAAMEPFHTYAPADQSSDSSGVSLSLTKALVEANRARFQIKTAPSSGTLIEVVFTNAMAKA